VSPLRGGDLRVGVSVRSDLLGDDGYAKTVARAVDTVTPENELKWDAVHPDPDKYEFGPAEKIVDFAREHDQRVRGHTLVWHNQSPGWLAAGHYDRRELIDVLREHIQHVVGHFRGRIAEWDVVNEAIADDGSLRHSIWRDTIGVQYIAMAFRFAHQADPAAKLVYNENGAEAPGRKARTVYLLVKALKDRGVPIDAVGFQTHVANKPIDRFARNLRRFAALGVDVELTEVDVRQSDCEDDEDEPRRQAAAYRRIVEACRAVRACREIVFWGLDDADSWITDADDGFSDATLLDGDLHPKPAYDAVREALLRG
jgi:endo-1,4-beta-xylanase